MDMGKNRSKQKSIRIKKKKNRNAIAVFMITFAAVCVAGIAVAAGYSWVNAGSADRSYSNFRIEEQDESSKLSASDEKQAVTAIRSENNKYADILADNDYMVKNHIYAKKAKSSDRIVMTFAGDILFDGHYAVMSRLKQNGGSISDAISPELIKLMQDADIMMLNNEFPYSDRGTPTEGKQYTFRAEPSTAGYLNEMGVDVVALANNHAYDYGADALADTFTALDKADIPYVGAGNDKQEAQMPTSFIIDNRKISIIAATQIERLDNPDTKGATDTSPGVFRCWDDTDLLADIRSAKKDSDFVAVYIHWGTENQEATDWAQEKQAKEIADAGADLIIGDHSHCLQRIGVEDGVPVVYSMGNFWFNSKTVDTGLIQVTLNNDGTDSLRFVPCIQKDCTTSLMTGDDKTALLAHMRSISAGVSIDDDGNITFAR